MQVPPQGVVSIPTPTFANYSVAFSPFFPDRLATASAANFGLVGNGRLNVIRTDGKTRGGVEKVFDTQDGLYDVAWSELHENQAVTGSGDGTIKLWDIGMNDFPIRNWTEHTREVFGVDWSNTKKDTFVSCSWDHTIKVWHPERPTSLTTLAAHTGCIYSALFSPSQPDTVASCSADGFLKIWDLRTPQPTFQPPPQPPPQMSGPNQSAPPPPPPPPNQMARPNSAIAAHGTEVLSCDWNKYVPHLIATGSVDRTIKIHDLRMAGRMVGGGGKQEAATVATLMGHDYAVRRVAYSPHSASRIASASYDMTARVWDTDPSLTDPARPPGQGIGGPNGAVSWGSSGFGGRLVGVHNAHTEFVVGLAWSLFDEGLIASCSWDQKVNLWRA